MTAKTTIMALAAIAILSGPAFANEPVKALHHHADAFTKADTNKDGSLSQDEFTAAKLPEGQTFAGYDTDANGSVSKDEWKTQQAAKPASAKKQ